VSVFGKHTEQSPSETLFAYPAQALQIHTLIATHSYLELHVHQQESKGVTHTINDVMPPTVAGRARL
jgi:hypothetical protein